MRILPVIDLLEGRVVRGVAGKREEYRPVNSVLVPGSDPLSIAKAIRARFGLTELYVADLDAILSRRANIAVLAALNDAGFSVMVDAGIRRSEDAESILAAGAHKVVAGLETLAGPSELMRLVRQYGADRVVFSLDLQDSRPLGDTVRWGGAAPLEIARQALEAGATELIVLDLAGVGTAEGVPTLSLCREIRKLHPQTAIITGGGVRGAADLRRLAKEPIDAVLVASALHNGAIGPEDLTGCHC
jgi:phosphoribosylformimino-5-aminoimidazole carboxamide ribotide isomerase